MLNRAGIDVVGEMRFDFSRIPWKSFESKYKKGRKLYLIEWDYKVYINDNEGVLRVKAFIDDKEMGTAEFDFNKSESGLKVPNPMPPTYSSLFPSLSDL